MDQNQHRPIPRIGEEAPNFQAITTTGEMDFHNYIGDSWAILFSHPGDFTPVCTTEMCGFAQELAWFTEHNVKLIGLSMDSIHSHLAWVNSVEKTTSTLLNFPIVADADRRVARLYGMIHPDECDAATVRALFMIDPNKKVRLLMYYPFNIGRSMEEVKRTMLALQLSDEHQVATPLDWTPGDKVIMPAPKTIHSMKAAESSDVEQVDFYLAKSFV